MRQTTLRKKIILKMYEYHLKHPYYNLVRDDLDIDENIDIEVLISNLKYLHDEDLIKMKLLEGNNFMICLRNKGIDLAENKKILSGYFTKKKNQFQSKDDEIISLLTEIRDLLKKK